MPIILRKFHTKYDLNRAQDKRVFTVAANQVKIATRYVTNVFVPRKLYTKCGFNMA